MTTAETAWTEAMRYGNRHDPYRFFDELRLTREQDVNAEFGFPGPDRFSHSRAVAVEDTNMAAGKRVHVRA